MERQFIKVGKYVFNLSQIQWIDLDGYDDTIMVYTAESEGAVKLSTKKKETQAFVEWLTMPARCIDVMELDSLL